MKKLDLRAGHEIYYNTDLMHLNNATVETTTALASLFGKSYYLNSIPTVVGLSLNLTCPAGSMVLLGEVCLFDAQSISNAVPPGTTLAWIKYDTVISDDPINFDDGTSTGSYNPHIITKARLGYVTTSTMDPLTCVAETDVLHPAEAVNAILESAWETPSVTGTNWSGSLLGWAPLACKACQNGKIEMRGIINVTASSPAAVPFTLPADCKPRFTTAVPITAYDPGTGNTALSIAKIASNGQVTVSYTSPYSIIIFEGVSFYK